MRSSGRPRIYRRLFCRQNALTAVRLEVVGDGIPGAVSCRVLKLFRQPYYQWLQESIGEPELVPAYRANALSIVFCQLEVGH